MNLTFPALEPPPPPPAVEIRVFRTVDGVRQDTRGIVSQDTPIMIGVTPTAGAGLRDVKVRGTSESYQTDPLRGEPGGHGLDRGVRPGRGGDLSGGGHGSHPGLEVITGTTTFRVIGAGGTDEIVEGPPEVIPARTVPKSGAKGVGVSSFLQVVFTEPVKKIAGNVTLADEEGDSRPDQDLGNPALRRDRGGPPKQPGRGGHQPDHPTAGGPAVRDDVHLEPHGRDRGPGRHAQPPGAVRDPLRDLRAREPHPTREGETYGSPGIVVLGDRAYLVENHFHSGTLKAYEATDPIEPREIKSARYAVVHRPVDIVGETESPLTGGRLVAVSTGPPARSTPSNVWVLDVSNDASTQWVGAVSLANSAGDGFINRTFMKNGVLYAATYRKGIQVVDLGKVIDGFAAPGTDAYFQMNQALFTDGRGFGQENVVSIPVSGPYGAAHLEDLEAGPVGPEGRLAVVASGDTGLTLVDPGTRQILSSGAVTVLAEDGQTEEATLDYGRALGLAKIETYDIAVVAGSGTALGEPQTLVMIVDISNPVAPVGLGWTALADTSVGDIIIKDDLALLGGSAQVTIVSLTDPTQPRITGVLDGVGGRLALTEDGLASSRQRGASSEEIRTSAAFVRRFSRVLRSSPGSRPTPFSLISRGISSTWSISSTGRFLP